METFVIRDFRFSYPEQGQAALRHLNFSIPAGQFVTLCGFSGCGKSTLLRQLKPVLAPHGSRAGTILFEGMPIEDLDQRTQAQRIGFVQQSPENQIVTDTVWHELAFGLESLGYDTPTIRGRVAETASFFGIQNWFHQKTATLSGGQKQLLNLAAVMVMQPSVLLLDEPTSQLDPIAASSFLSAVGKINRELGTTVLLSEHRLEEVFPLSDRVLVMDGGEILSDGTPAEVGLFLKAANHPMFFAMPTAMRVWGAVENELPCPVTVREGRDWLERYAAEYPLSPVPERRGDTPSEAPAVILKEVWFRYEKNAPDVLKGVTVQIQRGEFFALLGGNGTGKSTLLSLIGGLQKPYRGERNISGSVGILPQDPQTLFLKKTVREDLLEIENEKARLAPLISLCRLEGLLERHPYDLSGGEQQRVALAKVLLLAPDILLLDEPTKGLDAAFQRTLAEILHSLQRQGVTIFMVSHDVEFCAAFCDRCALFFDGAIVTENPPQAFFSGNRFYTTAANRMGRNHLPSAVTADDLITACGGTLPPPPSLSTPPESPPPVEKQATETPKKQKIPRRTLAAVGMLLLFIPLTLFLGISCFDSQRYDVISILILLETMIPFFFLFEKRKPRARELVILAVLCAIGVAGRAAFFMLPSFKPVTALVILTGVAFGGESGFLVGAVTMLASNVFFGQGPWTPWQMFAMGMIGFLSGVLFYGKKRRQGRTALCLFGAFCAIVLYGGIMNPASALLWTHTLQWQSVLAYYISGFPMDLIHAVSTALFLWLAAEPMLEKLERIKIKYGIVVR